MDTYMKSPLCVQTLENAVKANPDIRGAIIHSDRGNQYTSQIYQMRSANMAKAKHEQRRREMSRQRPLREHVG